MPEVKEMQQANEELEQYGRRLCIRIDGVPTVYNETSNEVLDKVKCLIKENSYDISNVVIGRAHRIGRGYNNKKTNAPCKSSIVRFTTVVCHKKSQAKNVYPFLCIPIFKTFNNF